MTPGTNTFAPQALGGDVRALFSSVDNLPDKARSVEPELSADLCAPRYSCGDILRFPLGDGRELVYSRSRRLARILSTQLANTLIACSKFKTIEEHASEINRQRLLKEDKVDSLISELLGQALPASFARLLQRARSFARSLEPRSPADSERVANPRQEVQELIRLGLMISESNLLALNAPRAFTLQQENRISSIGVVTRNRLESLETCLTSYIQNSKRHGRENDFVVMDDSESPLLRDQTRSMLRSLERDWDAEIYYGGFEEKKSFAEELAKTGAVPAEVVDFAIFGLDKCGCLTGANRNALLLHNVGDLFFSADDDTACRITSVPGATQNLALDSRKSLLGFWFFPTREAAFHTTATSERNILDIHEQLLGKNLTECISTSEDFSEVKFEQSTPQFLSSLGAAGPRVAVTFNGTVGDSGMQVSSECLSLDNASHQRLLDLLRAGESGGQSREVLRGVDCPTISDNMWCMSTALAFDNRELLPPFMPVQRNQDGLFGMTLRKCFPDKYFGHLPWAILHDPVELRSQPPAEFWKNARSSDCLAACMASLDLCPDVYNGRQRLKALGRHLVALGELPLPDFEEFVRIHLWRLQSSFISSLESHLQAQRNSSAAWATNFRRHIESLRQGLTEKDYVIPQTLLQGRTVAEARALLRLLVFKFGQLLFWWPEIMETAGMLRANGQRLAQPIH